MDEEGIAKSKYLEHFNEDEQLWVIQIDSVPFRQAPGNSVDDRLPWNSCMVSDAQFNLVLGFPCHQQSK